MVERSHGATFGRRREKSRLFRDQSSTPVFPPNSNGSIAVELYFVLPSRTFGSLSAVRQSIGSRNWALAHGAISNRLEVSSVPLFLVSCLRVLAASETYGAPFPLAFQQVRLAWPKALKI
jgi:hypothetical protein